MAEEENQIEKTEEEEKAEEKLGDKPPQKAKLSGTPKSETFRGLEKVSKIRDGENEEEIKEKITEPIEIKIKKDDKFEFIPKTKLGRIVKEGKIKDIDEILDKKLKILESEIVDLLLKLESELLAIGQSKGKFGGGKRRAWRQTQKKTAESNAPSFACMIAVGDKNGHVGLGLGKARETLPARSKALRESKLNVIKITRGCGSFNCSCKEEHSIPFKVEGKCGSSRVILMPAPQGTGIVAGSEIKKILILAGIKDIYSKTFGQTRTTINLAKACIEALKKTNRK